MHGSELMWRNGHQMRAAAAGSCPEWGEIKSSEILIATYNFKGQICHIRTDNAGFPTLNGIQVQLDFQLSFGNCFYYFLRCTAFVRVYFLVLSQRRKFLESNLFMFFLQGELHCQVSGIATHSQVFSFFLFLPKSWVLFELFLAPCA